MVAEREIVVGAACATATLSIAKISRVIEQPHVIVILHVFLSVNANGD